MAFDFTGKTAIVTGGTQGIGLEIAKGIVAGGGHVALIARNAAKGEAAVAELGEGNKFYQLDVADAPKARETVEQIFTDLPQTNILINCAGVISTKKFDEIDDTEWRRTIDINLNGTFTMMNAVYPHFKAAHAGTIVNVSSVAGKIGGGLLGTAAYASSKDGQPDARNVINAQWLVYDSILYQRRKERAAEAEQRAGSSPSETQPATGEERS